MNENYLENLIKNLFLVLLTLLSLNTAHSATSSENRANLKYQIAAGIVGREYLANPLTVSLGYFVNPNSILSLRYTNFNGTDSDGKGAKKSCV